MENIDETLEKLAQSILLKHKKVVKLTDKLMQSIIDEIDEEVLGLEPVARNKFIKELEELN